MKKKLAYIASAFALPALAFAQAINSAQSLAQFVINFINTIAVPFVFAIAFIVFIWGIFQRFVAKSDKAKSEGTQAAIWGIVGFFLMVAVWGLVNILVGTFNLNSEAPNYPSAPSGSVGNF